MSRARLSAGRAQFRRPDRHNAAAVRSRTPGCGDLMAGSEGREARQQIYVVLAGMAVSLIAATIGGLVAQWGYDASADLAELETASTVELGAEGPPRAALTPLSGEIPEFEDAGSIYVLVYSSVHVGNQRGLSSLAATLSIRNTSDKPRGRLHRSHGHRPRRADGRYRPARPGDPFKERRRSRPGSLRNRQRRRGTSRGDARRKTRSP